MTVRIRYWLRTVSTRASQHIRFIIVGTKVDKLSGSDKEVEAQAEGEEEVEAEEQGEGLSEVELEEEEHREALGE